MICRQTVFKNGIDASESDYSNVNSSSNTIARQILTNLIR